MASRNTKLLVLVLGAVLAVLAYDGWFAPLPRPGVTNDGSGLPMALEMPADLAAFYASARDPANAELRRWREATLTVAGGDARPVLLHARGQNSMRMARKSFTMDLRKRMEVLPGFRARKFYLLNLGFDPHGFEMTFSARMLGRQGVFPMFHRLVRLEINGEDQGLYLVMERPRDAIRRTHEDVVSVLRLHPDTTELRWKEKGIRPREAYFALERAMAIGEPEERARRIADLFDLDALEVWMAWNSLVENADSAGEIFLYEERTTGAPGRLGIVGWDYDDLMMPPAHPGEVFDDPLAWGAESRLERTVLRTTVLRSRYRDHLRSLLESEWTERALCSELDALRSVLDIVAPEGSRERRTAMADFRKGLLARRRELLATH